MELFRQIAFPKRGRVNSIKDVINNTFKDTFFSSIAHQSPNHDFGTELGNS